MINPEEVETEIPVCIPSIFLLLFANLAGSACLAAPNGYKAAANPSASRATDDPAAAPSITSQPADQTVRAGQAATFLVVASGTAPFTYQWRLNGVPISGANSSSYTTSAAAAVDNGSQFSVTISNSAGSATSDSATLTVSEAAPPGQPATSASLQEKHPRTSRLLNNFYVGVQAGYIGYAFSNAQLQPGFQAQSVQVPHLTTRFVLFGHEFGKYLAGQVSEIVPAHPVTYENVNGAGNFPLWMNNIAAFTAKARLPLNGRWSLFGEGGLGVVTRNGFTINKATALNPTNYATFLFGGGVDYRVTPNWDVLTGVLVAPGQSAGNHPTTTFFSGGFNYTMRNVPAEPGGGESANGPIWPRNIFQVGYITDAAGFGANNFFSQTLSIFWHGTVNVASGVSVSYHRNIFHTRRFFAIDWGADLSSWKSQVRGDRFVTASLYPAMRFPLLRTNPVELYVSYSLAGPSLITRTNIDGQDTGRHFTWQDYMSFGYYLGRKRRVTGEIRIAHYSNANLFPQNPGITIPLGFYFGTTF